MEIFEKLPDEINHLVSEFSSTPVVGDLSCGITQYSFWLIVSTIVLLIVLAVFKKKQTLVPKGFFVNGFEYIIEYVENDIGKGVVGENWKKHFPFLCSLFLFILINNMIGLIPGMKPGTGAIGSTAALAIFAFVYFIYYGCKAHGVIGYIKSLAPQGVSFPMNVLVWVVELFSTFLRLITLAVRLFCNMFAGHVVMGSFAIMASMFMQPLLQQVSAAHAVGALPSLAWLAILILIYAIELVVGAIQAYVFTVLTAVYVSEAEEVAEEEYSSVRALKVRQFVKPPVPVPMEPGSYKKVILREIRHARQRRNRGSYRLRSRCYRRWSCYRPVCSGCYGCYGPSA